jgi:2-oxo-4-hydroxy-4-carboxy--5-ureidoimidazoline (OHCU) decarboxylase
MPLPFLPPITTLPALPSTEHSRVLGLLFEPSPTLTQLFNPLLSAKLFPSYDALISAVESQLREIAKSEDQADLVSLEDVLSSHPRLGEKKVDSAMSRAEQGAMEKASGGVEGGEEDERKRVEQETLIELNKEYEEKFPGLRYVYGPSISPSRVSKTNYAQSVCQWPTKTGDIRRYAETHCSRRYRGGASRSYTGLTTIKNM